MSQPQQRKRHSVILRLALIAFAIYLLVSSISLEASLRKKKSELADLMSRKQSITLKNQELKNLIENGTENDYIERAARDRLGYVKTGEDVFTDISGNK